jgi:hypothetical protein
MHVPKLFLVAALTTAALGQSTPTVDQIDLADGQQVLEYLEAHIADDAAIVAFYQQVGDWEQLREMRHLDLPAPTWNHLAGARTRLVKQLYAQLHAEILQEAGVFLTNPEQESYFIGTPPSHPNFKGVFSDLDVGLLLDPQIDPNGKRTAMTVPQKQALLIDAKRRMEAALAQYGPDSGVLFDTNLYTTPKLRFGMDELDAEGRATLDRYDDMLAYLALRVGCGSGLARWLDLKQRIFVRALQRDESGGGAPVEPWVRGVVAEAEALYAQFEQVRTEAIAAAQANGQPVFEGLGDQAITRFYEDRMLAFIGEFGDAISADDAAGQKLRARFNMLKADYEASLRESYFTDAAQTYIVKWKSLNDAQRQAFLADPNHVRRVRADQARFILHYLHEPAGTSPEALRFKVQKIAKYEQRALNVMRDAGGTLVTLPGFATQEVLDLYSQMKGKTTPEEAWVVWRAANHNRLHGRELGLAVPDAELAAAEDYAVQRAKAFLEHIEARLVDIATELPVVAAGAGVTETTSPVETILRWQNSSDHAVLVFRAGGGEEQYVASVAPHTRGQCSAMTGEPFVFRDARDESVVVSFAVNDSIQSVEVGPTPGVIAYDADGRPALDIRFVSSFQWVYDDHDTGAAMDCSIWRVKDDAKPKGYHSLGYLMLSAKGGGANPSGKIAVPVVKDVSPNGDALKMGLSGHRVWNDAGSGGSHDVTMYALAAPDGYKALGSYCWSSLYRHDEATKLACVREDLVALGHFGSLVWSDAGSGADNDVRVYSAEASPVEDGFKRLNSMSFVPISPQAAVSEHASPWRNGTPSNEFARVLKFREVR